MAPNTPRRPPHPHLSITLSRHCTNLLVLLEGGEGERKGGVVALCGKIPTASELCGKIPTASELCSKIPTASRSVARSPRPLATERDPHGLHPLEAISFPIRNNVVYCSGESDLSVNIITYGAFVI